MPDRLASGSGLNDPGARLAGQCIEPGAPPGKSGSACQPCSALQIRARLPDTCDLVQDLTPRERLRATPPNILER